MAIINHQSIIMIIIIFLTPISGKISLKCEGGWFVSAAGGGRGTDSDDENGR